jgi:hypothetical protein
LASATTAFCQPERSRSASAHAETRDRIRVALKARLVAAADGSIAMTARAWAVQGTVPPNPAPNRTGRYAAS